MIVLPTKQTASSIVAAQTGMPKGFGRAAPGKTRWGGSFRPCPPLPRK